MYWKSKINKFLMAEANSQPNHEDLSKSPEDKNYNKKNCKKEGLEKIDKDAQRTTRSSKSEHRIINHKILNRTELGLVGAAVVMKYRNTEGFVWRSNDINVSKGWKDKFLARNVPVADYFDSKSRQIPKDLREQVQRLSDEFNLDLKIPTLPKLTKPKSKRS